MEMHPNRSWKVIRTLAVTIATLFGFSHGTTAQAQVQFTKPSIARTSNELPTPIQQLLTEAEDFEQQNRWGDALSVYQRGSKQFPTNLKIKARRKQARIRFDLDRRYADSRYLKTVSQSTDSAALSAYGEVLVKIQSYYVDTPDWQSMVQHGVAGLEVALRDTRFRNRWMGNVSDQQIENAIRGMQQTVNAYRVGNRHDAYLLASSVSRQLKNQLNVHPPACLFEFIYGSIAALDPYSAFMTEVQYSETMSQIEGNFVGLGVELQTQPDKLKIVSVIPNGPAGSAGLAKGDEILMVANQSVSDIGSDRAADLLRGVEGSKVTLRIRRPDASLHNLTVQRRRVEIPSVSKVEMVSGAPAVGYIQISSFQKTTTRDFDAALWKLQKQGMRSLIVDVRGNPGGLLTAAVDIANRFVGAGVIVSTHGRNPLEDFVHKAQLTGTWRVPLVVLIDEDSASASEIFAAAIADHHRGQIVGRRSYGKGSVQGIFPLNASGGGIRLTTAKFYSPQGRAIHLNGVAPDVPVVKAAKPAGNSIDHQTDLELKTGIQIALRQVAR